MGSAASCVDAEKLAGGRLNIRTQQQAVWSPLRGDMRECCVEKQPGPPDVSVRTVCGDDGSSGRENLRGQQ